MNTDLLKMLSTKSPATFSEREFFSGTSLWKQLNKQAELDLELEAVKTNLKAPSTVSAKKAETHTVTKTNPQSTSKQTGPSAPQVQGIK